MMRKGTRAKQIYILPALVLALAVLACLFLYKGDNKYTRGGPRAVNGLLLLDEAALAAFPVLYLVDDWEYYGGRLLSPGDFAAGAPPVDEYVFLGQYGGFEREGNMAPHGSATYRLNIVVPAEARPYLLELPEIFSACRVYVNGRLVSALGEPEPERYRPETRNAVASFEAGGRVEIIVAVSDFSHLYSGMVYPPAFGDPQAVWQILSARLLFRGVLCAAAAAIGLIALFVGLLRRAGQPLRFALLCLLFIGYGGYPLWRSFWGGFYPLYAVENLSFCAMLLLVVHIQRVADGVADRGERAGRLLLFFGLFVCLATVLVHLLLPTGQLLHMRAYSWLVSAYQWITACYLTFSALRAVFAGRVRSLPLLCGILIFDAALMMDRLLPLYEPVITGWFLELASFALVLCIALVIGRDIAAQYGENVILAERARSAERLSETRETYYGLVRQEAEAAKTARHDLRHHLLTIGGLVRGRRYEELDAYVAEYAGGIQMETTLRYAENEALNALAHYYAHLAKRHGIALSMELKTPGEMEVSNVDLSAVVSNLLENAVEACLLVEDGPRRISFSARLQGRLLAIHMENSVKKAPPPAGGRDRRGYGLMSVRSIAGKYGGEADFSLDAERGLFISTVLLSCGAGENA